MSGSPVRRSDAPDASQSEICKQLARVVLDFAKPVYLTQPANRGIGIIVYKDPRNSRVDVPEYDLMVTESRAVWKSNRSDSAPRTRESHNVASIVVDSSMARARGWSTRLIPHRSQVWVRTAERYKTPTDVVIMELERFEDFLGLHAPTRWYKFATRVSNDICIQGEPCKRAELVRHVRAVAKLAGGIRVLRAKKD